MSFSPLGKKGDVTISAMISGYNEGLLSDVGATKPVMNYSENSL